MCKSMTLPCREPVWEAGRTGWAASRSRALRAASLGGEERQRKARRQQPATLTGHCLCAQHVEGLVQVASQPPREMPSLINPIVPTGKRRQRTSHQPAREHMAGRWPNPDAHATWRPSQSSARVPAPQRSRNLPDRQLVGWQQSRTVGWGWGVLWPEASPHCGLSDSERELPCTPFQSLLTSCPPLPVFTCPFGIRRLGKKSILGCHL